jgi:hypothetical protein
VGWLAAYYHCPRSNSRRCRGIGSDHSRGKGTVQAYVREFEKETDAQSIYRCICDHDLKSTKAAIAASDILTYITSCKPIAWLYGKLCPTLAKSSSLVRSPSRPRRAFLFGTKEGYTPKCCPPCIGLQCCEGNS